MHAAAERAYAPCVSSLARISLPQDDLMGPREVVLPEGQVSDRDRQIPSEAFLLWLDHTDTLPHSTSNQAYTLRINLPTPDPLAAIGSRRPRTTLTAAMGQSQTGGITAAISIARGDAITVRIQELGSVSLRFA